MNGYIIDAAAMGPLIIPDEANELIGILPEALGSDKALVPQHWRLEVANLARMAIRKRRLTERLLVDAFVALSVFTVILDSETDRYSWKNTLDLATRHDLTAYDAAYLELALRTDRAIITRDKALIRAASAETIAIIKT